MVFAYVLLKGWIIDPYVQCFFDCSTEVLVFPPNYIEVINSDLVTADVTMVKDWGGCLLMFFEPLCKSSRGFTNVFLITVNPATLKPIDGLNVFLLSVDVEEWSRQCLLCGIVYLPHCTLMVYCDGCPNVNTCQCGLASCKQ